MANRPLCSGRAGSCGPPASDGMGCWRITKVWPSRLTYHLRSYLIERLGPAGAEPDALESRRDQEPEEASVRSALILALGGIGSDRLARAEQDRLVAKCLQLYKTDPDAEVHAATEWLLRRWERRDDLVRVIRDHLASG